MSGATQRYDNNESTLLFLNPPKRRSSQVS